MFVKDGKEQGVPYVVFVIDIRENLVGTLSEWSESSCYKIVAYTTSPLPQFNVV